MPAPATNNELNDVILKSGVVEDARLKSYLKKLSDASDGLPADPSGLAGAMVRDGLLTYFQAEQLLQGKYKRFFIGKYKILERLGVGGMGQVFLGEHKLMKRRVALKVLPAAKSQDEAALSRFYREARAVAAVDHPNIVRAYDIDQDENLHFIVMEFVDGANFHDLVKRHGPMDILRACHYLYGATVGLHHAHEMGLVHRDIKPANILVDRTGVVKLLDMGLARFFHPDEDDMLTKKFDENVLGTADYLAPEQAIDSSTVDIRADIYGLGGTFYYMLTGLPPFPEGSVAQKLLWHQTKAPKSIRTIRPEVPEELEKIVNRMLAKTPEERFQTPAELMTELVPWVQTPIPPPPEHEMPYLSAAASAGFATRSTGPGSGAPLATASSSYSTTPAPQTTGGDPTIARVKTVSRPPSGIPAPPVTVANSNMAKPVVTTAPSAQTEVAAPAAVWESLTADTISNNLADTANTKKKLKATEKSEATTPMPSRAAAKKSKSLLPWIIAASVGFVFVIVLASVTVYYATRKNPTDDPPTSPASRVPQRWYVSSTGYGPDHPNSHVRKTVQDAIKDARNGDTITILDDRIEVPQVQIGYSSLKQKMALHIEAGNASKNVTWIFKPAVGGKTPFAVDFVNLEDSTIEGITFETGPAEIGLRVQGACSGTRFQNLTIRNVKKTAIQLQGVDAADGKPLKLTKVRISPEAGPDKSYENAIEFTGPTNNNIEITDCRLENATKGTALRIDCHATNIEFRNNRVYNFEQGFFILGTPDKAKSLSLKILNNTFYRMRASGLIAEAAINSPTRTVIFDRNLFVKSVDLCNAPLPSNGVKATNNGAHDGKEGPISLKTEVVSGFNLGTTRPDMGDEFLRGTNNMRPVIESSKIPVGIE